MESKKIEDQHRHFDEILKRSGQTHHEDKEHATTSSSTLSTRAAAFYDIPAVKFILRAMVHLYGTSLYFVLVYKFKSPAMVERDKPNGLDAAMPFLHDANPIEIMWLMYEIGVWLDLRHQQLMRNRSHVHAEGSLERVRLVSDALIIIALGIRIAMEIGYQRRKGNDEELVDFFDKARDLYEAYQVVIALKVIVVGSGWMPFFSEYQRLGVLFIMVTEMIHDVVDWILLFTVVTGSFMLSFLGLQNAGHYTNDVNHDEWQDLSLEELEVNFRTFAANAGVWSPLWSLFGEFDCVRYSWLASIMMWIYMLTGSIVLVNLLVAMFAETFGRVKEQSEMEYVYLRCTRLFEYKHVILAVPPIFNMPIVLRDFAINIGSGKTARRLGSSLAKMCACFSRGKETQVEFERHQQRRKHGDSISEKTLPKFVTGKTASFTEDRTESPPPTVGSVEAGRKERVKHVKRMSIIDGGLGTPRNSDRSDMTPRSSLVTTSLVKGKSKEPVVPLSVAGGKLARTSTTKELGGDGSSNHGSAKRLMPNAPQKRKQNLFDGKLLAIDYLKKVLKEEADTVHALTRSLRSELQNGMKQREAEFLRLATRVGGLENSLCQMDEINESIKDIRGTLDRLVHGGSAEEAIGSRPGGVVHSEG